MEGSALRERHLWWAFLAVALVLGGWTTVDAYRLIGQPYAGFSVMRNLLVGLGAERGGLEPLDYLRAGDVSWRRTSGRRRSPPEISTASSWKGFCPACSSWGWAPPCSCSNRAPPA